MSTTAENRARIISQQLTELGPGLWGRKVPLEERKLDPEFVKKLGEMSGSEEFKKELQRVTDYYQGLGLVR